METRTVDAEQHAREPPPGIRPYDEMGMPPALRMPRWLRFALGAAAVAGPLAGLASRRRPLAFRIARSILVGSGLLYGIAAGLDLAEHFRLEKEVTGHYLRRRVVTPTEALTHVGLLGINASLLLFVRPIRRPLGLRDYWILSVRRSTWRSGGPTSSRSTDGARRTARTSSTRPSTSRRASCRWPSTRRASATGGDQRQGGAPRGTVGPSGDARLGRPWQVGERSGGVARSQA